MDEQQIAQHAMIMLAKAGNAKRKLAKVLEILAKEKINESEITDLLDEAHELIVMAHREQNAVIKEVETITYSMLLTHAQDTLMNVETIEFMTKSMVNLKQRSES